MKNLVVLNFLLVVAAISISNFSTAQGLDWVKYAGSLPKNVIYGGTENGTKLAVCRCFYNDSYHSGKVVGTGCNFGWGGKEITSTTFEILVDIRPTFAWEKIVENKMPFNAVVSGEENGNYLYVGQANYAGGVHPGKVLWTGSEYICNIGYGGKEITVTDFKVMVIQDIYAGR